MTDFSLSCQVPALQSGQRLHFASLCLSFFKHEKTALPFVIYAKKRRDSAASAGIFVGTTFAEFTGYEGGWKNEAEAIFFIFRCRLPAAVVDGLSPVSLGTDGGGASQMVP